MFLCQSYHEILIGRITENNIEILKQDHEKEVETLKEEAKRLKEEIISLQRQNEEGEQLNSDLQEQISQLTKQVKTIPDLHRDLAGLQNQLSSMDRRMKQSSEQARGAGLMFPQHINKQNLAFKSVIFMFFLQLKSAILRGNFCTVPLKRRFFWGDSKQIYTHFSHLLHSNLKCLCSIG